MLCILNLFIVVVNKVILLLLLLLTLLLSARPYFLAPLVHASVCLSPMPSDFFHTFLQFLHSLHFCEWNVFSTNANLRLEMQRKLLMKRTPIQIWLLFFCIFTFHFSMGSQVVSLLFSLLFSPARYSILSGDQEILVFLCFFEKWFLDILYA